MENKENKTSWVQWVTLVCVVFSWLIVPYFTERARKKADVGIWQHTAMSNAHKNLVAALYEFEEYLNELTLKYNCDVNILTFKITNNEFNKANRLIRQANKELAMMYVMMPDDKYQFIQDTIESGQMATLSKHRYDLLITMRKSQFPNTEYDKLENITIFKTLKRPGPELIVTGFTKAAAEGDTKLAQSYFLRGSEDYQGIWEVLTSEPGSSKYPMRLMMESIDVNQPIEVTSKEETKHGLKVKWRVTFGKGVTVEGQKVEAGTQYDFDATLKLTEEGWFIDNF